VPVSISSHLIFQQGTFPTYPFIVERYAINPSNQHELPKLLGKLILESYRSKDMLREQYQAQDRELLAVYLESLVFPTDRNGNSHGRPETAVRSGDFGEVVTAKIATEFHGLTLPFPKMMWKLRKDRSSFCTDIFAHDSGTPFTDLHYYEVKTRKSLQRESSRVREGNFWIAVIAHDSLVKDQEGPSDQIADFLRRQLFEHSELFHAAGNAEEAAKSRSLSAQYGQIIDNRNMHSRNYWVALVLDKTSAFSEDILTELQNLPPELRPMKIAVVLFDDLPSLIKSSFKAAFDEAFDFVYGGSNT
jgi:hypothetical protein